MKQIKNIQQHFSIRKLSIGAASVLIGLSFLGWGTQTVHADEVNTASGTDKTEQLGTITPANEDKDVKTDVTVSDNKVATEPVSNVKVEENKQEPVVAKPVADNSTEKTAAPVPASDVDANVPAKEGDAGKTTALAKSTDTTKEDVEAPTTPAINNTEADATKTKSAKDEVKPTTPVADTTKPDNGDSTTSTFKVPKKTQILDKKNLKVQLNSEDPAVDTSKWELYGGDNGVYVLNWMDVPGASFLDQHSYTGDNVTDIVIPDAADFRKDSRYTNIKSLEIKNGLLTYFFDMPGIKSISISKTGGEKVVASTDKTIWYYLMQNAAPTLTRIDLSNLDTSTIDNPQAMFASTDPNGGHLESLDLTGWDTSHFRTMDHMFQNQPHLTEIKGLSDWNTSNVTNMSSMFDGDSSLTSIGDLSTKANGVWDTSKVTNMSSMFKGNKALQNIGDISGWKVDNVTDMSQMFADTPSLKENISGWNNTKANQQEMFDNSAVTIGGLALNNDGLKSYLNNYKNATSIDVGNLNTSKVTDMSNLFNGFTNLTKVTGLDHWDTSNVTNMQQMFAGDTNLTQLQGISNWDTSKVTDMNAMFKGDRALQNIGDISGWKVDNVTDMSHMFADTPSLKETISGWNNNIAKQEGILDNSAVTIGGLALNNDGLKSYLNNYKNTSSIDVGNLNTSKVTDMSNLFRGFNNLTKVTGLDHWDTSSVTNMSGMFYGDSKLTSVGDLSTKANGVWDTSNVTDMSYMFFCDSTDGLGGGHLTGLNLSGWKTSKVTNMYLMFAGQRKLATLTGLSNWDTSKVTDMGGTFQYLASLNNLDLSHWNTGNVTTMRQMFAGDTNLKQIKGLSNFDFSNVTDTSLMFQDTHSLDQIDLSQNIKPKNLKDSFYMFAMSGARLINLSNWDLSNSNVSHMFAALKKPATIILNNVKANYGEVTDRGVLTQLDLNAFAGTDNPAERMPLVVISDNPTFIKNVNSQYIFFSSADWELARQNEDKFDLKGKIGNTIIDLGTVHMDLAYPSETAVLESIVNKIEQHLQEYDAQNGTDYAQRWLKSMDVENNQMKPSTHKLAENLAPYFENGRASILPMMLMLASDPENDYSNSLPALITGTYTIDLKEKSNDNHGSGDNPGTKTEPGQPTSPVEPTTPVQPTKPVEPTTPVQPTKPAQPTKPVQPTKPAKPSKPGKSTKSGKSTKPGTKHTTGKKAEASTQKRANGYNYNSSVRGENVNGKGNTPSSNAMPHAENAAPNAEALPNGYTVNSKGQILNAKGQVVGYVDKNGHMHLPQTGEKSAASLGWLGLGLASLAALIGLAGDRKRR